MTADLPANHRLVELLTEVVQQSCLETMHNINTVPVLSLTYNVGCYPNITNDKDWPTVFSPGLTQLVFSVCG